MRVNVGVRDAVGVSVKVGVGVTVGRCVRVDVGPAGRVVVLDGLAWRVGTSVGSAEGDALGGTAASAVCVGTGDAVSSELNSPASGD